MSKAPPVDREAVAVLRAAVRPLDRPAAEDDQFVRSIAGARFVLLGEATHGTAEFYRERALLTRRLIEQEGFNVVAVEADWPDASRVNRYVHGMGDDPDAEAALGDFRRFPTWMWRNAEVRDFVRWLREFNGSLPPGSDRSVGFFGLDLYSLHSSIEAVISYLDQHDPTEAERARRRYGCFDHFREDPQDYAVATSLGLSDSCEDEVVAQLLELQRRAFELAKRDGHLAQDDYFDAEQNARLARNAERYYRSLYHGRVASWNLRDRHMAETLDALVGHLTRRGRPAKVVVWAHNSHLGDARATEMEAQGELNIGQLVRESYGDQARLVGFTTYAGTVTAAQDWDAPPRQLGVRPALAGSFELLFHQLGPARFLLPLRDGDAAELLAQSRLERAIGVVYRPESERLSHYFEARISRQFDAVIHLDQTSALAPLDRSPGDGHEDLPDTYPSGV